MLPLQAVAPEDPSGGQSSLPAFALVSCIVLASSGCETSAPQSESHQIARSDHAFEVSKGGLNPVDGHQDITEDGLAFLFEDVAEAIGEANEYTDDDDNPLNSKTNSIYHVDNCRVPEAFANLTVMYRQTLGALDPDNTDLATAESTFGTILHTSQDFYAHSNWIEGAGPVLVSENQLEWPVVTEGTMLGPMMYFSKNGPAGAAVRRETTSRLPYISFDGFATQTKGLITGTYDNGMEGTACMGNGISIPHGPLYPNAWPYPNLESWEFLAKDAPGSKNHDEAVAVATSQTTEEFCRLDRLLRLRYGDPGHALLLREWVEDDGEFERTCSLNAGMVTALLNTVI